MEREEAVARIRAAVDARDESGSDIVIVARTDSRQTISMVPLRKHTILSQPVVILTHFPCQEEALWRVNAFADAGADMLFVDALESEVRASFHVVYNVVVGMIVA